MAIVGFKGLIMDVKWISNVLVMANSTLMDVLDLYYVMYWFYMNLKWT